MTPVAVGILLALGELIANQALNFQMHGHQHKWDL